MSSRYASKLGWFLTASVVFLAGCEREDSDRLARVGRTIVAKTNELTTGANDQLAGGWAAVQADLDQMTLEARVSARLRWDKALAGAQIEVQSAGGALELHGKVADAAQRRRAVELAESTAGAEKVVDKLEEMNHETHEIHEKKD